MVNRLSSETSAYLQKHSNNPVDWYPWGDDAFKKAKNEDKPLFISIGYFSCHWCSVMERESFEDEETAKFMNANFVNIKIDREEKPDIDKIYQRYYTTLTGEGGGWPLNMYAFPDGLPFYGITYLPKKFSLRSRTFMSLNREIVESWKNEREQLFEISLGLSRNLVSSNRIMIKAKGKLEDINLVNEIVGIQEKMDWQNGGIIDGDTKFPRFSTLRFLLKEAKYRKSNNILRFLNITFDKMSKGGIYDQLNGGIARYSVDRKWIIPHFEKMLYDQAGWLRFSSELYQITQNDYIKYILDDMLNFIKKELYLPTGGFYSSIHAESEGVEGKYYSFTHDEIKQVLDQNYFGKYYNIGFLRIGIGKPEFLLNEDWKIAKLRYSISRLGNFKDPHGIIVGGNVLAIKNSITQISKKLDLDPQYVADRLGIIKEKLTKYQMTRKKPPTDTKIITAWNAMMITSLLGMYCATLELDAREMALSSLNYILDNHLVGDKLIRSSDIAVKDSERYTEGILDDYSFLIEALINAFEITNEYRFIETALKLNQILERKFYSSEDGIYYLNKGKNDAEIGRILSAMDDSFQSALSVQIVNLFKLGSYSENPNLISIGQEILLRLAEPASEYKGSMSEYFIASGYFLRYPSEIVVVNDRQKLFDDLILRQYQPERLIYRWPRSDNAPKWEILEGRDSSERPTVFICNGATCSLPQTTTDQLQTYFTA